jgi:CheY-like chemotaxis protein
VTGPAGRGRRLLWADDEIDLLEPHRRYLETHGWEVTGVPTGEDALALAAGSDFDLVLLDVGMPGLDGLSVLERLRVLRPGLPVVLVTQREEEALMEAALGREAEYLSKPVNPSQVLAVCKRILDGNRLRGAHRARDWTEDFTRFGRRLAFSPGPADWGELAEGLAHWNLRSDREDREGLADSLAGLEREADGVLARQVASAWPAWTADARPWAVRLREDLAAARASSADAADGFLPPLSGPEGRPLLVTDVLARGVLPLLEPSGRVLLLVLDCLRYDQWLAIAAAGLPEAAVERSPVFSLLPTSSPWSRNALLSGRFPDEVAAAFPELWEEGWAEAPEGPNRREPDLLAAALEAVRPDLPAARLGAFERVGAPGDAEGVQRRLAPGLPPGLSVVVVSFLDLLAHGQADSAVLQELAPDAAALRGLAAAWFERSPLRALMTAALQQGVPVVVASDHGSVRVDRPVEVRADRSATGGLRVKVGRNLNAADERRTVRVDDLAAWRLPPHRLTTTYLLALDDAFLVFPNEAAPYRRRFQGSFQHGGISLWELVVPLVRMVPR